MGVKVITEPSVFLVGRQQVDEAELDRFLGSEDVEGWSTDTEVAGQKLVECAGRLCYMSFAKPRPGGNAGYIGHILEVGHGSVLEHAVFNFILTGVSRSFTHELIRHRAGFGFSQLSQRFVDESSADFVVPEALAEEVVAARSFMEQYGHSEAYGALYSIRTNSGEIRPNPRFFPGEAVEAGLVWLYAAETARMAYGRLSAYGTEKITKAEFDASDVNDPRMIGSEKTWTFDDWKRNQDRDSRTRIRKQAREAARSVLPNATETKIFVTANGRALRHFIEMRGDASADAEIRKVALALLKVLRFEAPALFGDYRVESAGGVDSVVTDYRKV